MKHATYRNTVLGLGNYTHVARMLSIERETMSRRCNGHLKVTREMWLAIQHLKHLHIGQPPVRPAFAQKKRYQVALTPAELNWMKMEKATKMAAADAHEVDEDIPAVLGLTKKDDFDL